MSEKQSGRADFRENGRSCACALPGSDNHCLYKEDMWRTPSGAKILLKIHICPDGDGADLGVATIFEWFK